MGRPVTIVGAGVAGLCVARALRDRGLAVRLLDRAEVPGPQACSWWAGGMLAPHCEGESAEEPVVRLGADAADWWAGHGIAVTRGGTLVLSQQRDRADLRRFARRTTHHDTIDAEAIARLEPDLAGRFSQALHFAQEGHLAPRAALATLRDGLLRDDVPIVRQDADPDALARDALVVDCRGYAARDALPGLRGVKGEMLILRCPEITLSRTVRLLHPRIPLYVVPRGDGIFMLGATTLETAAGAHVSARALLELLGAGYALHPAFAEAEVIEIGVDSRPAFPDNLPRISRQGDVIRVNGLYRHGFLLAPALARMVAAYICDNKEPEVMQ
ncbi:FAD-dependent oxidoreductase [Brevirhabdus sp.]|uniref:FAD-dependent oxidoreductase n=1 Tax=Brevirhabdus sp. TaxID=2004514 RepID=UPI0040598E70